MKTTLFISLLAITIAIGCKSPKKAVEKQPEAVAVKTQQATIDTLIIRQICDYCLGEKSQFMPQKFSKYTVCVCYYEYYENESNSTEKQILAVAPTVKHIIFENPSQYIFSVPFEKFTSLQSLFIFGNDYNTDGLNTFPESLLTSETLGLIEFDGVRFDLKELARIKKQYPKITIKGDISDVSGY